MVQTPYLVVSNTDCLCHHVVHAAKRTLKEVRHTQEHEHPANRSLSIDIHSDQATLINYKAKGRELLNTLLTPIGTRANCFHLFSNGLGIAIFAVLYYYVGVQLLYFSSQDRHPHPLLCRSVHPTVIKYSTTSLFQALTTIPRSHGNNLVQLLSYSSLSSVPPSLPPSPVPQSSNQPHS